MCDMKLNQSNPFLKSAADRKGVLHISAQSSAAVEGIRAPFTEGKGRQGPPARRHSLLTGSGTSLRAIGNPRQHGGQQHVGAAHWRMNARDVDTFAATVMGLKSKAGNLPVILRAARGFASGDHCRPETGGTKMSTA
jgi:hypothetical protein